MENIRSACPHACVWMSVCLKKENESVCVCVCGCVCPRAENMFVIKMTEYEGEVPLEGWVATYLHTHTHTYTHTHTTLDVFFTSSWGSAMLHCAFVGVTSRNQTSNPSDFCATSTNRRHIHLCPNHTHAYIDTNRHTPLWRSLWLTPAHTRRLAHTHTHTERWLQMWVWCLYTLICERELAVLCVSTSPSLFWLPASSAQPH